MTTEADAGLNGSRPFGQGAAAYIGWTGIIPIHRRTKVPFQGFTGRNGLQATYEQSVEAAQDRKYAACNLALRLPMGIIGLDVDAYDDKPGGRTLERLERELGSLPPTWRSGSRMPEDRISGIRLYRVPDDLEFDGVAGPGIEIVQHHHRTVMAWPSVHPKTGRIYRWADDSGELSDFPPIPELLPDLPPAWVDHLASASSGEHVIGDGTPAAEFLAEHTGTDNPRLFDRVSEKFRAAVAEGKARHDSMLIALGCAMRDAAKGYYPAAVAEERLREMWDGATAGENRDQEYLDLLTVATAGVSTSAEQLKRRIFEDENGEVRARTGGDNRFTDAFMAQTVADDVLATRFCWAPGTGWLCWDGKIWNRCDESSAVEAVRQYVVGQVQASAQMARELQDGALTELGGWTKLLSRGRLQAITGLAKAIVAVNDDRLDSDPDLMNCQNGIVDLRSGVLLDHNADRMMTRICAVDYDPSAYSPDWDTVLSAMPDDVQDWMQERMGQAATGYRTPDDRCPILQGSGENGKTTFTAGIAGALGTYHVLVPDALLLGKQQRDESMVLRSARFALMEETPQGAFLNSVMLKKATSPEMTGHHLYASETTWKTTHSLFVTTNYRPVVSETDDGTWRRLALVEFPYRYVRSNPDSGNNEKLGDPGLRVKIEKNDPDILRAALRWIIEGARKWYAAGEVLSELPDRVTKDTRTWRRETDLVLAYTDECTTFDPRRHVRSGELLLDFNDWLTSRGHHAWSERTFSQQFGSHGEVTRHHVSKATKRKSPELSELGTFDRHGGQFPIQRTSLYKAWVGIMFREDQKEDPIDPFQDHVTAVTAKSKVRQNVLHGATLDFAVTTVTSQVSGGMEDHELDVDMTETSPKAVPNHDREKRPVTAVTKIAEDAMGTPETSPTPTLADPFADYEQPAPGEPVGLDLETASADEIFTYGAGGTRRPGYVRLVGAGPEDNVITGDTGALELVTGNSNTLVGHNLALFDLIALDKHEGIPVEETIPRAHDLRFAAFQADPPTSAETSPGPHFKSYSLDALGERYLSRPKSDLGKALVQEYGGWDRIPFDDDRYHAYCRDDVRLALALAAELPMTDYDRREMRVAAITARATLEGFRVDVPGLTARVAELAEQAAAGREMLASRYGFPLLNKAGKEAKAPQRTAAGKEAFERALGLLGLDVSDWPRGKDGTLSMAKEIMSDVVDWATENDHPALAVLRAVQEMNGLRTNAANILRCVTADGRVHPFFTPFQSTGRWSVQEPGLTVAKKGTEDSEREFLLPEPGHVVVCFDANQVDIRCVAGHSQDPGLLEIMRDPDRDIHNEVSDMAFGRHDDPYRHHAKSCDLGWLYGRSVNGLANTPGITREAAEKVDRSMRTQFRTVLDWQHDVRQRAENGGILDNGFGRRLRCEPDREYTQAPAMLGQSATRDIVAEGLLTMKNRCPDLIPLLRVIVHDEIVMSIPEDRLEETTAAVLDCMTMEFRGVPITWGASRPGRTWGQCYRKD